MGWLDGHELGYLAWSWNAFGRCDPETNSTVWSLVQDYYSPEPNDNDYARAIRDQFAALAGVEQP
jgi:hypothetical protein